MQQLARIRNSLIAAILALSVIAAAPPNEKSKVTLIPLSDIDRASVRVQTPRDGVGAQLVFLFRDRDAQQTRRTFATNRTRRVRITDGATVITETTLFGIVEDGNGQKKRNGLVLWFDTVEEASKVAAALRPFLR